MDVEVDPDFNVSPKLRSIHSGEIVVLKQLQHNHDAASTSRGKKLGNFSIHVSHIEVKNLTSRAVIGKANPYVVITLGAERLKTKVKWNEPNAVWKDEIVFRDVPSDLRSVGELEVSVYDKERIARKTLLGSVTLAIDGVDLNPIESWFALQEGQLGSTAEIYLQVNMRPS